MQLEVELAQKVRFYCMKKQALLMGLLILSSGLAHADPEADFDAAQARKAHEELIHTIQSSIRAAGIGDTDFGDFKKVSGGCSEYGCSDDTYYIESSSHTCQLTMKNGTDEVTNTICDRR